MSEQSELLKPRTYQFTLDVIELSKTFPTVEPGPTIKRQLLKAATSVGAN
jgi:four helix bundle protein